MTPTVKLVLRSQKLRPDGTAPVYLRVTHGRRSRFASLGIWIEPKHWNEKKSRVRASHPLAKQLNAKLEDWYLSAQAAALSARGLDDVLAAIGSTGGTFTDYFERFIERLQRQDRYWDERKYRGTLGKLHGALGRPVLWTHLDRSGLTRFEQYLRTKKGNNPNTVRKELSRLRTVVRQAVKDGVIGVEGNPFPAYDMPAGQPVERRRLTLPEIERLAALELPFGELNRVVRDLYLFSFYGAGIRVSDALCLRPDSIRDGRLEYRMLKTGHLQSVKLPAQALQLAAPYLEADRVRRLSATPGRTPYPYLFPLMKRGDDADPVRLRRRIQSATAQANEALKELAELAGLDPEGLSTHTARHSFADLARTRGNLFAVSKALGHSKLQTTQVYLSSFDRAAVDELTDSMFGAPPAEDVTPSGDGIAGDEALGPEPPQPVEPVPLPVEAPPLSSGEATR